MTKQYIPERSDIIFLDFEPKKGYEIGKYRPALVLSSIVQTLSWQDRKAKLIKKASSDIFEAVLQRLLPLLGANS